MEKLLFYRLDVILNDSKPFHIDTCGFVFILTEEEFLRMENSLDLNDGSDDCLILVNFTGTINLYMVSPSGEQWIPEPLDLTEYLQFQNPPENDWYDVVLDLEGTYDAAVKVTGSHELIKACHG